MGIESLPGFTPAARLRWRPSSAHIRQRAGQGGVRALAHGCAGQTGCFAWRRRRPQGRLIVSAWEIYGSALED